MSHGSFMAPIALFDQWFKECAGLAFGSLSQVSLYVLRIFISSKILLRQRNLGLGNLFYLL